MFQSAFSLFCCQAYTPYQPSFASSYPAQHLNDDMAAQPTLYGPAHLFADDFLFNDPLLPIMQITDAEVDAWFNMPPQVPNCCYDTSYHLNVFLYTGISVRRILESVGDVVFLRVPRIRG